MKNKGPVAKVGPDTFLGRGVVVDVVSCEGVAGDLSMLSTVVSNLTRGRFLRVTGRLLATSERVEMGESGGTVAIIGNRFNVDVVCCGKVSYSLVER
jgi:hypothetical protein